MVTQKNDQLLCQAVRVQRRAAPPLDQLHARMEHPIRMQSTAAAPRAIRRTPPASCRVQGSHEISEHQQAAFAMPRAGRRSGFAGTGSLLSADTTGPLESRPLPPLAHLASYQVLADLASTKRSTWNGGERVAGGYSFRSSCVARAFDHQTRASPLRS